MQVGFANPKEITIYYAHIQFGLHLTLMAEVQKQYDHLQITNRGDKDDGDEVHAQLMEWVYFYFKVWLVFEWLTTFSDMYSSWLDDGDLKNTFHLLHLCKGA